MEHCPAFRRVILHFRVDSPRVTNPFAEGLNPLDLHALSTLPAFILSQDQTLSKTARSRKATLRGRRCHEVTEVTFRGPTFAKNERRVYNRT